MSMSHSKEFELLDHYQTDVAAQAAEIEDASDGEVDRRQFMFRSLVAAAATTLGVGASARAQETTPPPPGGAPAGGGGFEGGGGGRGNQAPPVPIDNME